MGKGSVLDIFILGAAGLILAIGILIGSTVMTALQTSTVEIMPSAGAIEAMAQGTAAVNTFNYGFIVIFFGMGIGGLIAAYLVPTHPIMIVASVLMLVISMVVLPAISNSYETFAAAPAMAAAAANFSLIGLVMGNLPLIGAVFGFLMIIVLFMRYNSSGGTA